MAMPATDDIALWYALYRLMTDYWAEVDHSGGERAHEFYISNALYLYSCSYSNG